MAYMLMILEPRGQRAERTLEQGRDLYERMVAFGGTLKARGLLLAADALRSDDEGARVQVRDERRSVVDGPFAEAREMVGGFYLVDVDNREQALAIAAECPAARWATIEVRQIGTCYE